MLESEVDYCIFCHRLTTDPPRQCLDPHGHDYVSDPNFLREILLRRVEYMDD